MKLSRSDQARVNGAKSHGPKTALGKARSSLNAVKHARYATNAIVLSNEDSEAFDDLVANYVRRIQPTDTLEFNLASELAAIEWRLTRTVALDTRLLDHEMEIQSPALNAAGVAVPQLTRLMTADRGIVERSPYPTYLARREAQLTRARRSILSVLRDLRKYFPAADAALEVIPPQPLNPDLPVLNDPECRADPLVRAEPPGSASNNSVSGAALSVSGAASNNSAPGSEAAEPGGSARIRGSAPLAEPSGSASLTPKAAEPGGSARIWGSALLPELTTNSPNLLKAA